MKRIKGPIGGFIKIQINMQLQSLQSSLAGLAKLLPHPAGLIRCAGVGYKHIQ
jgi:hypothetical protein